VLIVSGAFGEHRDDMKIVMRFVCVNAGDGEVECAEHIKSKTCLYNQCESLTEL